MNAVIKCLMNHRSIRKYRNKPVEAEVLDTILLTGTRAATAGNLQLYSFLVIDDREQLDRLDAAMEVPFFGRSGCPVAIFALADHYRVRQWLKAHSNHNVESSRPYNFFMAEWDALIALQNVVVAAESLGLGTCYLGSGVEVNVRELSGVPELVFPAGLVGVGYPDTSPALSSRLPLEAVVHHNCYRLPTMDDIMAWYEERDHVWESVPAKRKQELMAQGIPGIAQAVAVQKFSPGVVEKRSRGIIDNLNRAGFEIPTGAS